MLMISPNLVYILAAQKEKRISVQKRIVLKLAVLRSFSELKAVGAKRLGTLNSMSY
jgi:hypothetical protein